MTRSEETNSLADERDRLDEKVDELADLIHETEEEDGVGSAEALRHHANQLAARGRGVAYLIDEYGEDAEVAFRGLDSGQYAKVDDHVAQIQQQNQSGPVPGARRNVFAAAGLVDAPFLEDTDPDFDAALGTITDQPVEVTKYIEGRVNALTTVDQGNWTPLRERLEARQTD